MVADITMGVGLVLLTVGLALWSVPLALSVLGGLLLTAGVASHLWSSPHDPGPTVPPPGE